MRPIVPPAVWYVKATRTVKKEWIKKFLPMATEIHITRFGYPKHRAVNNPYEYAILIDDSDEQRALWTRGMAIDPRTTDIVSYIRGYLDATRVD
jgi:hypothetical protein